MRLIDADAINPMRCPQSIAEMREWFDEIPTAYDIDKVVEQLEEASHWTEPHYDEDGYSCDDEYEVITFDTAIEIVKKGGNV